MEELEKQKNNAYWERNQMVLALSKLFPAFLGKHEETDKEWDEDWRNIVYVYIPTDTNMPRGSWDTRHTFGSEEIPKHQISWHIHDNDLPLFDHLDFGNPREWDHHDTQQKYRRLRHLKPQWRGFEPIKNKLQQTNTI